MAQINKRIIFLKNLSKGGIAGTAGLTETSHSITLRLSVNLPKGQERLMLALEGDGLPFTLLDMGTLSAVNKTAELPVRAALSQNISALLFKRSSNASEITGYGQCGSNGIKAETLLNRAEKRLIGAKIVPLQDVKTEYKKENKEKPPPAAVYKEEIIDGGAFKDLKKAYEEFKSDDPYMHEDTTALSDIDIIAEENYFEKDYGKNDSQKAASAENVFDMQTANTYEYVKENPYNFDDYEFKVRGGVFSDIDEDTDYKEREYKDMVYYEKVKGKLLKLLSENEKDTQLCGIIPQSEFVRIAYDGGKHYCVGIVRENGIPAYICYGVPGEYSETPPEEFENCGRWIPLDAAAPKGEGYWMMFQNVTDGKCVRS